MTAGSSIDVIGAGSGVIPVKRARVIGAAGRGPAINSPSAAVAVPQMTGIIPSFGGQGGQPADVLPFVSPIPLPPGTTYVQSASASGVINMECDAEYDSCSFHATSVAAMLKYVLPGHIGMATSPLSDQTDTIWIDETDPQEGELLGEEPITPVVVFDALVGSLTSDVTADVSQGIANMSGHQQFVVEGSGVGLSAGFTQRTVQTTTLRYDFSTGDWVQVAFTADWHGSSEPSPEHIAFARMTVSVAGVQHINSASYTVTPAWFDVPISAWGEGYGFSVAPVTSLPPMVFGKVQTGDAKSALIAV